MLTCLMSPVPQRQYTMFAKWYGRLIQEALGNVQTDSDLLCPRR